MHDLHIGSLVSLLHHLSVKINGKSVFSNDIYKSITDIYDKVHVFSVEALLLELIPRVFFKERKGYSY